MTRMGSSGEVDMSRVGKLTRPFEYMGQSEWEFLLGVQGTLGGHEGSYMDQVHKNLASRTFFIVHFV